MAMRKGLGKGLGALIGDYNEQPDAPSEGAVTLPLQKIEPNPLQPRKTFNPEELDSLADSIRMHGIIQPDGTQAAVRVLSDHRRRTPLACGTAGRAYRCAGRGH